MGLVLTRKVGESVVIDGTIIITVLRSGESKVRLDIVAPKQVPVDRLEVHEAKQREQSFNHGVLRHDSEEKRECVGSGEGQTEEVPQGPQE